MTNRPARKAPSDDEFRLRSHEISRIEAFSDVVFGFSLTLLVVSLEVPRTYTELIADMRGFVPFAICFALLAQVWWLHHNFFRRYGLEDATTATLKFVFTGLFNQITGHTEIRAATSQIVSWMQPEQASALMVIYGLGYAAVFLVFLLLYRNALRKREELELTPLEIFDTRTSMMESGFQLFVGLLCAVVAGALPSRMGGLSGYLFFLLPIGMTIIGTRRGSARRKLQTTLATERST
jgi:uncharacterized membrane protein